MRLVGLLHGEVRAPKPGEIEDEGYIHFICIFNLLIHFVRQAGLYSNWPIFHPSLSTLFCRNTLR